MYQTEEGEDCEEGEEGCIAKPYQLELQNRDLFSALLIKEMLKKDEIKDLPNNAEEAKAEALELLDGEKNTELKILK
jgi:hypothetical protein